MILQKKYGTPFSLEIHAKSYNANHLHRNGKVIQVEGGWAVEIDEELYKEIRENPQTKSAEQDIPDEEPIETQETKEETKEEVKTPDVTIMKQKIRPEDSVEFDKPYPNVGFTGVFEEPKITYVPEECKNPRFTYKFILKESFTGGDMYGNWQTDTEVNRKLKESSKYQHLSSSGQYLIRGKRNQFILCRMPKEMKEARNKMLDEKNKKALNSFEDPNKDIHSAGLV